MAFRERVEAAMTRPPLSEMSAEQRAELDELLADAEEIEDLPGKWQAALVAAEESGD
ncbi:MAG: hypothetical protein ACJ76V_05155 [Thermoleophilaceae bacterium]